MSTLFSDPPPDHELLTGLVERVTFHSADTGFAVLKVRLRDRGEPVAVVGTIAAVSVGEQVQASGAWVQDRTHGRQFKATYLHVAPPTSPEGIERFLGSGFIRGVGPHFARRLVAAFGAEVFDVFERQPDRLRDVEGIGPTRAARMVESWRAQRAVRDIMLFLHAHGVGTSRAHRIYKTYGADAIGMVRANPWRLARDIRGIGFPTADQLAQRLGVDPRSPARLRAGVAYLLEQAQGEGHCGLPEQQLREAGASLLESDLDLVIGAIEAEVEDGAIVRDRLEGEPCLFLAPMYHAEREIASRLLALAQGRPPWPDFDVDRAVQWVEEKLAIVLAPSQGAALRAALASKVLVLTGGPGVGKTTLLRAVLRILGAKRVTAQLAAPTGRAARRLAEATGLEARTIHRLLEVDPRTGGFRRVETHPIDADLVVVDEASMIDVPLMHALVRAVPPRAALLLVGDVDQLPSVGPGQVLADLIASGAVPIVRLTEVFRQAEASRIVVAAHRVNRGELPEIRGASPDGDFHFIEVTDPDEAARRIVQIVAERIPSRFGLHPVRDVQVLSPMHRGTLGARALNEALQRTLNPRPRTRLERFGVTFGEGDKVMQIENDYDKDVYNGDVGVVAHIDEAMSAVTVDFDGRKVVYDTNDLDTLVLAYATTIHKAQGSEYPAVVVPLTTQHFPMLQRNLVYTAMTRGRKLVVIVGQVKALAMAVRGANAVRRWTRLKEWLKPPKP